MKIVDNWWHVLTKAWSVKLMALSGVIDVMERALPYMDQTMFPPGALGWVALAVLALAGVSRFVAQEELSNAPHPADPDEK